MSQAANATAQRAFVLGGGIVGVCCAYALQRSGFTTTLIEKGAPGHAASFGNSASIGLASVPPLGMPGMMRNLPRMLMDPNHALVIRLRHLPQTLPWLMRFRRTLSPVRVQAITNARAGLLSHAGNAYKSLLVEIGRTELIRTTGLIFAYESRRSFEGARAGLALRRSHGIEVQELDGPALRDLEPAISDRAVCGVHFPIVQTVTNPLDLTEAILGAFRARGGRVLCKSVRGFETGPAGISRIVTDAARHECDLAVLAAGAWSGRLARMLGDRVSIVPERGYHIMIAAPPHMPAIPVVSGDHNVSISTLTTGLRMTTMAELTSIDAPADYARALRIFRAAAPLIRRLELDTTTPWASRWMGARPSTPDSLPVIGRSPRHRNTIYACGHGHLGVTFGAITGAIVGSLARGETPNFDITPYRPDRPFDGSHLTNRC